jgi:hypothetical protein
VVTPTQQRAAADYLSEQYKVSQRRIADVLGVSRSTLRYNRRPPADDEAPLIREIKRLARRHPRYGYRFIHALARRRGFTVNLKRVHRLWRELGLRRPVRLQKLRTSTPPTCLPYAPDGRSLAWAEKNRVVLWQPESVARPEEILQPAVEPIFALAFSPDGRTLATTSGLSIQLWDAAILHPTIRLSGHKAAVRSLAFSSDGTMLASGDAPGRSRSGGRRELGRVQAIGPNLETPRRPGWYHVTILLERFRSAFRLAAAPADSKSHRVGRAFEAHHDPVGRMVGLED